MARRWNQQVLDRYEEQKKTPQPVRATTVHVVRLGDVVICTNPFELFAAYGIQLKSRSPANQTFVIQLVGGGPCCYVPTELAVRGGGYSAIDSVERSRAQGWANARRRNPKVDRWHVGKAEPGREVRVNHSKIIHFNTEEVCGMWRALLPTVGILFGLLLGATPSPAAELLVGAAQADITPPEPTALDGQFELRIAQKADTPLTANVLVLDSRENGRSLDVAVMVSCDLIIISDPLAGAVREAVSRRLPELDLQKIVLNATHTHTAPLTLNGVYDIPKTGVMQVDEYCRFAGERIAEAIEKAWKGRAPASLTWGLGHAVVAQNRRAVFADGHAELAGNTDRPEFRGLEAGEDHDLGSLFFWNKQGKLVAIVVNVPCPAQEVEGLSSINADFWHPTRSAPETLWGGRLRARLGRLGRRPVAASHASQGGRGTHARAPQDFAA